MWTLTRLRVGMKRISRRWFLGLLAAIPATAAAQVPHARSRQYWNDFVRSFTGWQDNLFTVQDALKKDAPLTQSVDTITAVRHADSVFKKLGKVWRTFCREIN